MKDDLLKSKKQISADKILQSAARFLRTKGLQGASVAKIMGSAGFTVGGFYAHFQSKEDLIKKTFRLMALEAQEFIAKLPGPKGSDRARAFFETFLSRESRDHPERGCPVAALAGDMSRESAALRRVFAQELEVLVDQRIRQFSDREPGPESRARAYELTCTYVGALILSRATKGEPISDEILDAARARLVAGTSERKHK